MDVVREGSLGPRVCNLGLLFANGLSSSVNREPEPKEPEPKNSVLCSVPVISVPIPGSFGLVIDSWLNLPTLTPNPPVPGPFVKQTDAWIGSKWLQIIRLHIAPSTLHLSTSAVCFSPHCATISSFQNQRVDAHALQWFSAHPSISV